VTLGAIALAGSLAFVVLAVRARSDDLLRRAAKKTARVEAQFQKEAAIVSGDPGSLFVWRNIDGDVRRAQGRRGSPACWRTTRMAIERCAEHAGMGGRCFR
jgi:hypothetical protein